MATKVPWPEKLKIWEPHYLKNTPLDRIRREWGTGPEGEAPSWDTVNRVVEEFPLLTHAQVRQLPVALQERWQELQSEAEQQAPKEERVGHEPREEISHEQQPEGKLVARQPIQEWRNISQRLSPIQLLDRELNNASQEALSDFFTNRAEKKANDRARERHFVSLTLALNRDPAYLSLRERFPQSTLLATLDASLNAWQECVPTYMSAFFDLMYQVKEWVKTLMDSMTKEASVDGRNLSAHITNYRKHRAYAVLVTRDLLIHGLSELPSDARWASLLVDLDNLRVRLNLELSSLTGVTRKGGWPTSADLMWADTLDSTGVVGRTRTYLNEFVKLKSAQDSLETALCELETRLGDSNGRGR